MTDWQAHTSDNDELALSPAMGGPLPLVLAGFLVLVVVGGTIDLALDRPQTLLSWHVAFEGTMVLVSLSFAIVLFRGWSRTARELGRANAFLSESNKALAQRQAERDHWRKSAELALSGFSLEIDRQFDAWQLSPAERQVALLVLKGVGHKQSAAQLGRSERTIRQHAVEVYRKAGLQGRAELAAFFLHDLSLPDRKDAPKA